MRIAIDLTPTVQSHAGLGRYAGELARALQSSAPADERYSIFYDDPSGRLPPSPLDELPRQALAMNNKLWRATVATAYAARLGQDRLIGSPDVFLATDHLLPRLAKASSVFLLADVTFLTHPEMHSVMNRGYLRIMMPHFLRAADRVITISSCSLERAVAYYPLVKRKIHVVYPGVPSWAAPVDDGAALRAVRERLALPARFLLYVGMIEPRKNLATLVDAFARAHLGGVGLVIAGRTGWMSSAIFEQVRRLALEHLVTFAGFVPDEDLPALYSAAEAFVFPSVYEGFGLPVLEAMACGAPVICSNASSLPEVAGDAAVLLPPRDADSWARAMVEIVGNPGLKRDLGERGLRRSARFTWRAAADQTRRLLREVADRRVPVN